MQQSRSDRGLDEAGEISAQLQPLYKKLHRDLESMVQKEVARFAAGTEGEVRSALADIARRGGIRRGGLAWPKWLPRPAFVLVPALALAAIVFWTRPDWTGLSAGPATQVGTGRFTPGEVIDSTPERSPTPPAPSDPATRVAEFDDLFKKHSDRFAGLVQTIRDANPAERLEVALQAWEHGETQDSVGLNLVHSALVQAALKQSNAAIVIDGVINRDTCAGASCRAIQALFQADQSGFGFLPRYAQPLKPEDLKSIEKILVMGRLGAR
ncbi:MAG TPA: hypothetical protein VFS20_11535 [Longimicrobium sp.]|nr:hypothetical protein [Longimicrobium sp.]